MFIVANYRIQMYQSDGAFSPLPSHARVVAGFGGGCSRSDCRLLLVARRYAHISEHIMILTGTDPEKIPTS
jgi:hypothetical protein